MNFRAMLGRFVMEVGGQGGGHRRLLESDRNWQESDNAFRTPCTPKGGGGFQGLRPTRRPSKDRVRNIAGCSAALEEFGEGLGIGLLGLIFLWTDNANKDFSNMLVV